MAATRRNILTNTTDRNRFIDACIALKTEPTGFTTAQLGIPGGTRASQRNLSTWDLFVIWHLRSMRQSSSDGRRNSAHSGPVFLPWHRWYMLVLEFEMRRVLGVGQDDFGIPYWDWATDGTALTPSQQVNSAQLWSHVGGNGVGFEREVVDGPFTYSNFPINLEQAPNGAMRATDRGLERDFGSEISSLPTQAQTQTAMAPDFYDEVNFDNTSDGFRNRVEGWHASVNPPGTHNRVHVWIGGDMLPGTSPNDPLFYLNHCNVDRLWSQWQSTHSNASYVPTGTSVSQNDPLFRQRAGDPLFSILTSDPPVSAMLDVARFYTYA